MKLVVLLVALFGLISARPLQWFSDKTYESYSDSSVQKSLTDVVEKDWEFPSTHAHLHTMDGPTSFLQTSTGGHPLECDCERVKCNCVKRCECGLPAATENRQAAQFLELASATGKSTAPLWVDIDTNECFLQTGESVGQDTHHMLDCECDKVKCNCVKHCECSLPATATGSGTGTNNLLQLDQGTGLKKPEAKKETEEEEEQKKPQEEQLVQKTTETKKATEEEVVKTPKVTSRTRGSKKEQTPVQKSKTEDKDEYANNQYSQYSNAEKSAYSYSYSGNEEYSS